MALEDPGSYTLFPPDKDKKFHTLRFKRADKRVHTFIGFEEECQEVLAAWKAELLTAANASPVSTQPSAGVKHDEDKPRLDLISPVWLEGVGKVLAFGAKKYEPHNWRKGLAVCRLLASTMRHILQFMAGEDLDKESGLPHLHHASAGLMMATEMWATRPDMDDRWKSQIK